LLHVRRGALITKGIKTSAAVNDNQNRERQAVFAKVCDLLPGAIFVNEEVFAFQSADRLGGLLFKDQGIHLNQVNVDLDYFCDRRIRFLRFAGCGAISVDVFAGVCDVTSWPEIKITAKAADAIDKRSSRVSLPLRIRPSFPPLRAIIARNLEKFPQSTFGSPNGPTDRTGPPRRKENLPRELFATPPNYSGPI
jgi:hypothetical protein